MLQDEANRADCATHVLQVRAAWSPMLRLRPLVASMRRVLCMFLSSCIPTRALQVRVACVLMLRQRIAVASQRRVLYMFMSARIHINTYVKQAKRVTSIFPHKPLGAPGPRSTKKL